MTDTRSKTAPSGFGPGSRLAQAREDRGLSVEEAARALRMSPRHIQALESDDYENLPGPTYVRGYLRSYAQLLGLPADEIVASYNSLSVAQQPVDLGKLAPPAQMSSDHHLIRLVTVLVLGLFVVLAGLWWYGGTEPPAAPIPSSPPSSQAPETKSPGAILDSGAAATPAPSGKKPFGADSREGVPPSGGTPRVPPAGGGERQSGSYAAPTAAPRADAPSPDRILPAAPAPTAGNGAPRARLVLQALEESWAEVRDATGNRLLYETIPAGRTVSVEGAAPLSVFLGNVDGVRVEFNGKPYDAGRHRRGPVARFTLGEAQTARPPDATR